MHDIFNFAYLDPGTGSLIIQSLIGAVAGVAVFGRRIFYGAKAKLTGKRAADTAKTATPSTTDKAAPTTKTDYANN